MNIIHNALVGFGTVEKQNAPSKARGLNKNDTKHPARGCFLTWSTDPGLKTRTVQYSGFTEGRVLGNSPVVRFYERDSKRNKYQLWS
jgi:hypothetical protein